MGAWLVDAVGWFDVVIRAMVGAEEKGIGCLTVFR